MTKTETLTKYDAYDQPIERSTVETSINENGQVLQEAQYDAGGNQLLEVNYYYEGDNLIRIEQIAGGMTQLVKHMTYNENNIKIKEIWLAFDDIKMYEMTRDPAQLELHIKEYDLEGELLVERLHVLDNDSNLVKEIIDDAYIVESTYTNGKLAKTEVSDSGEKIQTEEFEFDEEGNEIGRSIIDHSSGQQTIIKAELDESNNKLREYFYQDEKLVFDKSYAYDDQNRITMLGTRSAQGKEVIEYSYSS